MKIPSTLRAFISAAQGRNLFLRHFIITTIFGLLFLTKLMAQSNPAYTRSYLNNIVEIGLSDYGIITGEDSSNIYFIAVRRVITEKQDYAERIAPVIKKVKFYNGTYRTKAVKLSEIRIGAFALVLYESARPATSQWQRNYYHSLTYKKGKLSTFRDKWLSDKIWSVHDTKIAVIKQGKTGVMTLKVPRDAGVAKGMPLINSDGFMAGMLTESTLGKTVIRAISMQDIANALYILGKNDCRYFSMVEWGKEDNRCVLEEKARIAAAEKALLDAEAKFKQPAETVADSTVTDTIKKEKKNHFIDYGINVSLLADPLMDNNPAKDNYFSTRAFHAGLSFHFNIDKKGANRLTLKPRFGSFYEKTNQNFWVSPGGEVSIFITSYKYAEMPIVFERRIINASNFSISLGAGYSPGLVFDHKYDLWEKATTSIYKQSVSGGGSNIIHRVVGELYFYESKSLRVAAVYRKDLSGYPHQTYQLLVNGTNYTPFADRKKSWYIGLELGIRLRGSWSQPGIAD
ncbi:hypothetical protein [Terrimonas alba]|uniref:hypothetical protein n=1 Tax=Terrimonas alba TaxID=3349636 RepID=UPI0035F3AFAB